MIPSHYQFKIFLGKRLHLGISGSVAAYKSLELVRAFQSTGVDVGASLTAAAQKFITSLSFAALGADPVYDGMFGKEHGAFVHLEPAQSASAMLIAPATADIIAKLAYGLADDILSCQALAFDGPLLIAPAMNPRMWHSPATQENLQKLQRRGVQIIAPDYGQMACGEKGEGRLSSIEIIFIAALKAISPQDLSEQKVLITLGPTREYFDPVRFWSNPSSGKMGGGNRCCVLVAGR